MKKRKLEIIGLSYSQTQSGAYALVLGEDKGKRRLPIIIGGFEAQAIAIELEKMTPNRPLTHDLLSVAITTLGGDVNHILLSDLENDTFYAKVVLKANDETIQLDARPSDAIALAVRAKVPIFVEESVLDKAGVILDKESSERSSLQVEQEDLGTVKTQSKELNIEELSKLSAFKDFVDTLDLEGLE